MKESMQVGDYVIQIMNTKTKERVEYGELMDVQNTIEYIKGIMEQSIDSIARTTNIKYENGKVTRDGMEIKVPESMSVDEYIERKRKEKEMGR